VKHRGSEVRDQGSEVRYQTRLSAGAMRKFAFVEVVRLSDNRTSLKKREQMLAIARADGPARAVPSPGV